MVFTGQVFVAGTRYGIGLCLMFKLVLAITTFSFNLPGLGTNRFILASGLICVVFCTVVVGGLLLGGFATLLLTRGGGGPIVCGDLTL